MRLIHRPEQLPAGMTPQSLGFDAIQIPWRPFEEYDLSGRLKRFADLDILLALHPGPWWHDKQDRQARLTDMMAMAVAAIGPRLLGVRFNHEFRAPQYSSDDFGSWLMQHNRDHISP